MKNFGKIMTNLGQQGGQGSVKRRREAGTGKGGFNPLEFYDSLPEFDLRDAAFLTSMLPGKKENET
jgi:hypothetical protein